jgi:Replication-relaxation
VITKRHDEILLKIHRFRYVTAVDIARLFYAETSINYVREILSVLSGKGDYVERQYLFRIPLPDTRIGNTEKVYTLGRRGRVYLQDEVGMEVDWHFRPYKVAGMTYQKFRHALTLTHFLVALEVFCRDTKEWELHTLKTEYELVKEIAMENAQVILAPGSQDARKEEALSVIPDAWIKLYHPAKKKQPYLPILLEIDRGSEQSNHFKKQLKAQLQFVMPGGGYTKLLGTAQVTIAYLTTGNQTRLKTMMAWTEDIIKEFHLKPSDRKRYASLFRFCSLPMMDIRGSALFTAPVWSRLFEQKPLPLLASLECVRTIFTPLIGSGQVNSSEFSQPHTSVRLVRYEAAFW